MIGTVRDVVPFRRNATVAGRATLRAGLLGAMLALVAGCSQMQGDDASTGVYRLFNSSRNPGMETLENTVEYTIVPASRAMVNAPQALVVFERNLGGALEQRIVLPNATAVRGDNVLHVRAQNARSAELGRLDFNEVATRFGGLPAPFQQLNEGSLSSGSDSLGNYVYARETIGTDTNCVLVLRRLGVGARPLPRGTQALDVMMRNCVNGTVQEALAPMGDRALAITGAAGSGQTLSPYAAPRG
ncbi:MAG: hypothetical protein H6900_10130 [Rhodobacter sp.]|uniref:hypothetical protein n=1 Tax=Pararhodobacter sp. TaxID=2127056 RepID=UPI002BE4EAA3|nr:hypothetical protein [Pararhodobacter sp.]MCC0073632.1 hypothetical protein [Rhodobacter sp.]HPD91744.1 hypothetical protein [Pararhodobacter sp.]